MQILNLTQDNHPMLCQFLRQSTTQAKEIASLFRHFNTADIEAYIVGGFVRDGLLGKHSKDVDIEVFGTNSVDLLKVLEPLGTVNIVGAEFGVYKIRLNGIEFDITLARTENRVGRKHVDFEVKVDPTLTPAEACIRRDFTINALYLDPLKLQVIDYVGGIKDLLDFSTLRHINDEKFVEDPLRVLRGFQFAARFNLTVHPDTAELCRSLRHEYSSLSVERINGEWEKWATGGVENVSAGLKFLEDTKWIELYPELEALTLNGCQDVVYHPEGRDDSNCTISRRDSAWIHTKCVCDAMTSVLYGNFSRNINGYEFKKVMMYVALCHDLGKSVSTKAITRDGRLTYNSIGHEKAGIPLTKSFLKSIGYSPKFIALVTPLVEHHMAHCNYNENSDRKKAAEKLSHALQPNHSIATLELICEADAGGRPPLSDRLDENWLSVIDYAVSHNLHYNSVKLIVNGNILTKILSDLSIVCRGAQFGALLKAITTAQLNQKIHSVEDAERWIKQKFNNGKY